MNDHFDINEFLNNNPPPALKSKPPIPSKNGHGAKNEPKATMTVDENGNEIIDGKPATLPSPGASIRREAANNDELPQIVVSVKEHESIEEFIEILSTKNNIYKKGKSLVTIYKKRETGKNDSEYQDDLIQYSGTPQIEEIKLPKLRTMMTKYADWFTQYKNEDGDWDLKPIHPPEWAVAGVAADGNFLGIPEVNAIVECPILRPDGTIIENPGFDSATGIVYEPNSEYFPVSETVSYEDAVEAVNELSDIINEFPFASINGNPRTYKSAWLAALLTPFARFSFHGPCPLFLFDANVAGSGKSLLCDIISIICTGRNMSRTTYPSNDEEMRKRITSIGLSGDLFMMLDNIATQFGGSALDAVLTSVVWKDRILGKTELSREISIYTVWYATGNNIFLRGDIQRRIVPCSLDCDEEKPQDREFKYDNLSDHVRKNRRKYVQLCLTILRGFHQAGRPRICKTPLGSYERWSDAIRSCVLWVTGEDCIQAQDEYRSMHDSQFELKHSLIKGLYEIPDARSENGITVATILERAENAEQLMGSALKTLREALHEISGDTKHFPSTKQLGFKLKSMNNCRSGDYKLSSLLDKNLKVKKWFVTNRSDTSPAVELDADEASELFDSPSVTQKDLDYDAPS